MDAPRLGARVGQRAARALAIEHSSAKTILIARIFDHRVARVNISVIRVIRG